MTSGYLTSSGRWKGSRQGSTLVGPQGLMQRGLSWTIRCCPQRGQDQWLKGDFVTGTSRQEHDSLSPPHLEMGFCSAVLMTSQSQRSSCLSLLVLEYRYTALHLSSSQTQKPTAGLLSPTAQSSHFKATTQIMGCAHKITSTLSLCLQRSRIHYFFLSKLLVGC